MQNEIRPGRHAHPLADPPYSVKGSRTLSDPLFSETLAGTNVGGMDSRKRIFGFYGGTVLEDLRREISGGNVPRQFRAPLPHPGGQLLDTVVYNVVMVRVSLSEPVSGRRLVWRCWPIVSRL